MEVPRTYYLAMKSIRTLFSGDVPENSRLVVWSRNQCYSPVWNDMDISVRNFQCVKMNKACNSFIVYGGDVLWSMCCINNLMRLYSRQTLSAFKRKNEEHGTLRLERKRLSYSLFFLRVF
jgi:hypothetical protein